MNKTRITSEREFTPELLAAVNHLLPHLTSHATPMTEDALRLLLQTEATRLYTIRDEQDRICGMCTLCFTLMPTGKKCWLEDVVVDDACRGEGTRMVTGQPRVIEGVDADADRGVRFLPTSRTLENRLEKDNRITRSHGSHRR